MEFKVNELVKTLININPLHHKQSLLAEITSGTFVTIIS